jgi:hypothetical protein
MGLKGHQGGAEACWFCDELPAEPSSAATVEMHAGGFVGKTDQYHVEEKAEVPVPRCERCKSAHDRVEGLVAKGGLVGLAAGLVLAFFYLYDSGLESMMEKGTWKGALMVLGVCVLIGGVVAWALGSRLLPKGVRDQRTREQHPLVQQRIREGWKIGPKPPGL